MLFDGRNAWWWSLGGLVSMIEGCELILPVDGTNADTSGATTIPGTSGATTGTTGATTSGGGGNAGSSAGGGGNTGAGGTGTTTSSTGTGTTDTSSTTTVTCSSADVCDDKNLCTNDTCSSGTCHHDSVNEGQLCGQQPPNPCQEAVCVSGMCGLVNQPDFTVVMKGNAADCRDQFCKNGMSLPVPNSKNCPDVNPNDCVVGACGANGACTAAAAPQGAACIKNNQSNGKCNAVKQCCDLNLSNCDPAP